MTDIDIDYVKSNITTEWINNLNMLRVLCKMRIEIIDSRIDEENLGITGIDEFKKGVLLSINELIVAISERLVLGI
jgi:hypothetical protein